MTAVVPAPGAEAGPEPPPDPRTTLLRRAGAGLRSLTARAAGFTGPVRRRVGPLVAVVTPLGRVVLGSAVVLLIVGGIQGWAEYRAIGLVCLLAFAVGIVMTVGRPTYEVRVELDRARVLAGERALGRVVIRKKSGRSMFRGTFDLPVGRSAATFALPPLNAGGEHEQIFVVPTRRRSVVPIGPVRSVRGDPLGLLRREQRWPGAAELYVHPLTVPLDTGSVGLQRDIEGVTTHNLTSSDLSFHGLRDYTPGDDRRAIHWRTTARLQQLGMADRMVVRQFEETRRAHVLILLDVRSENYSSDDDFELAVSCAASIGLLALREERQLGVVTQAGPLATINGAVLLDQCSGVEVGSAADDLRTLVTAGLRRHPNASVVAVVTGAVPSAAELRAVDATIPVDAQSFTVRCDGSTPVARRRIGALTVLDVPVLEELRRAVRGL